MKFTLFLVAFALFAFVQAQEPEEAASESLEKEPRGIKDVLNAKNFVEKFRNSVRKATDSIKKGGQQGLNAAKKLVEELRGPCKDVNKVLKVGIIQKIPIPNIKIIATSIQATCAIVIYRGVPKNADDLKRFIAAFNGISN